MKLTDLGHDILLEVCGQVFEGAQINIWPAPSLILHVGRASPSDNPRDRVTLSWRDTRMEGPQSRIFPGPPAQVLLDLSPMHSALAIATRPYIWREVLVAARSLDKTEAGIGRLERAQRPHIAPFVRAIFLSLFDETEDILPSVVTAIPLFKSLRAVCLGSFQTYSHPRVPEDLAKVIREHHRIDTLSLLKMTQCAALVEENSSKEYSLELEYCDKKSAALLLRAKAIRFLRINRDLEKNFANNIWDTLEHLAVDPNHQSLQASLRVSA